VRRDDLVPAGGQADPEGLEQRRIVVDDEDLGHGGRSDHGAGRASRTGTVNTTRAPRLTSGSIQMEPTVGLDEGLGDGQAETRPCPRRRSG
jgi:hypothetical protein